MSTVNEFRDALGVGGSGSGNATVPGDASVLPPQSFVTTMQRVIDWLVVGDTTVDFSDAGQTYVDAGFLAGIDTIVFRANGFGATLICITNNWSQATLDDALAALSINCSTNSISAGGLTASGVDMPVPTPDSTYIAHVDGVVTVACDVGAGDGPFASFRDVDANLLEIDIDSSLAFTASSYVAGVVTIGTNIVDPPADNAAMAAKVVELTNGATLGGRAIASAAVGGTVTFTFVDDDSLPLNNAAGAASLSAAGVAGIAWAPNADLYALVNTYTKTITVNEYVNRASTPVPSGTIEEVTYAP